MPIPWCHKMRARVEKVDMLSCTQSMVNIRHNITIIIIICKLISNSGCMKGGVVAVSPVFSLLTARTFYLRIYLYLRGYPQFGLFSLDCLSIFRHYIAIFEENFPYASCYVPFSYIFWLITFMCPLYYNLRCSELSYFYVPIFCLDFEGGGVFPVFNFL